MVIYDELIELDMELAEGAVLLNIETTGLSPRSAFIYMIGMGWQEGHGIQTRCFLAESRMDERKLMESFHESLSRFKRIITFGGQSFSWRFMTSRWTNYGDDDLFAGKSMEDIQKNITPYKAAFALTDLKKYTVEDFIGFRRHSNQSGKDLMAVFSEWERNHDESSRSCILAHHRDDMYSLLHLSLLSAYTDFWNGNFKRVISWQLKDDVCIFRLLLYRPVTQALHYQTEYCIIDLKDQEARIHMPVYQGELKYFFPGPVKDYYYLPSEDQAVHHSVARYVDKVFRKRATAATCYTRKAGIFLPTDDSHIQPHFQEEYHSKDYYILYDPESWTDNPDLLNRYLSSCIKQLPQ